MGRLIDADAITKSKELAKKVKSYSLTPYINVDDLLEFIDNLPTAYDVEKVVEGLKEESYFVIPRGKSAGYCADTVIDIGDAISIVERGGVE